MCHAGAGGLRKQADGLHVGGVARERSLSGSGEEIILVDAADSVGEVFGSFVENSYSFSSWFLLVDVRRVSCRS